MFSQYGTDENRGTGDASVKFQQETLQLQRENTQLRVSYCEVIFHLTIRRAFILVYIICTLNFIMDFFCIVGGTG